MAWSAREDFLQDLAKAETGKDYQLVASSGDNLRYVCTLFGDGGGEGGGCRVKNGMY